MPDGTSLPIQVEFYGVAAMMALSQLVTLLVSKGVITREEGAQIWSTTAEGLKPPDHPGIKPLREMIRSLSEGILATPDQPADQAGRG